MSRLRNIYDGGQDAHHFLIQKVEESLETAQKSSSVSTQVLAYRLWVQADLQFFDFYKQASVETLASCFGKSRMEFNAEIQKKQEDLITEAKAVIELGLSIATSITQVWFDAYDLSYL